MNVEQDVLGKTITGIIATGAKSGGVREIWLLQFSDGTHVEFVSPRAKGSLRKAAQNPLPDRNRPRMDTPQLALNVA
jgi:hypothetical protein